MRNVQRQAYAGMLWNKQYYRYLVERWLEGDPTEPPPPESRKDGRNHDWWHMSAEDVLSMPDKWEYPWFAAWDMAFHAITFAMIDPDFAKQQLLLLTREWYMHPNGQIPAYEWAFSDVNPPVHAWAAMRVYQIEEKFYGRTDRDFLERIFQKLLINFTWWVNRKDAEGNNIFEGGFLGLDNISVFDRTSGLPVGGHLEQADGTSWMAMYCLNLLGLALELAKKDSVYEDVATKFFEHFIYIGAAINKMGGQGLWNADDGYYYDQLRLPDGRCIPIKAQTISGLIPIFAVAVADREAIAGFGDFNKRLRWFAKNKPELLRGLGDITRRGVQDRAPAGARRYRQIETHPDAGARSRAHVQSARRALGFEVSPRASVAPDAGRQGAHARLRAGGVDGRAVRRQLELARSRVVSAELPADRGAAEARRGSRRNVQGRMPDRVGERD